jgi:AraC-like DNA-binding protein
MHRVRFAPPSAALRTVIDHWAYREIDVERAVYVPLPARPLQFIEWYLHAPITLVDWETGDRTRPPGRATIVGAQTRRILDIELLGTYRTFTMHFVPTGFHRLTGATMREFTDAAFDARDVLGREADRLSDALQAAPDFAACIALAETFVARRLDRIPAWSVVDAAAITMRETGRADGQAIRRATGLSVRQFERRFASSVGMPAATYLRICRFHQALERKEQRPGLDWTTIAADLGYFDQSHFARDCKALAGEPASHFLERSLVSSATVEMS